MILLMSIFTLTTSSLSLTLLGKDLDISTICMDNKHPCIPETYDCSEKFYATSFSLLISIKQLLTMIDPDYLSNPGSFTTFPGIQSAVLIPKASSSWNQEGTADLCRFHMNFNGKSIGWCASQYDSNRYLQVGSSIPFVFEKFILSGRNELDNWITSYKISYSLDGVTWVPYKNSQIFEGNSNSKDPIEQVLDPFVARSVKIIPISWVVYTGGSFEFLISKAVYSNTLPANTLLSAVAIGLKLTSSSVWSNDCSVTNAGYDISLPVTGCACWCAGIDDINQWIMITSSVPVKWKRIGTMGDSFYEQRTNSYYIMYSVDGTTWQNYKNKQVFSGNTDKTTKVEYDLEEFTAISIRLHPLTWTLHVCTRIEAYYVSI